MYFLLSVIFALASRCNAFHFQSKMYLTLDQTSPCILRMNGTHTFGCTSPRQGNVGVLHLVSNDSDLKWVLNSSPMNSYIIALPNQMFTRDNLLKMNATSKVSGILLVQNQHRNEIGPVSPEDTCPNRYSGLAAPPLRKNVCEEPWNIIGSGILQDRWNIPMFFTKDNDTIVQLQKCFKTNAPYDESQTSRSLCALQLSSHMFGAVDSRTCLRRNAGSFNINPIKYCDEMGGENLYVPLIAIDKFKPPSRKSYVIVGTRLDSTTLFYQNNPASLSVATSLVTSLLAAKLLSDMTRGQDTSKYQQNVLFIFFSGEAYDYIGSSRVVYDLSKNQYPSADQPISKDEIDLYIELSQLYNDTKTFYHSNSNVFSFIDRLSSKINVTLGNVTTLNNSTRSTVPPSSMQNFLLMNKDLPSVLLSSYDKSFTNQHYHSLFDDDYNIHYEYVGRNGSVPNDSLQSFVAGFATALAATLYEQISQLDANVSAIVTKEDADELLHCYVDTLSCELAKDIGISLFSEDKIVQPDYYVGVVKGQTHWITENTKRFLTYYTNYNDEILTQDQCTDQNAFWLPNKNLCVKSLVNYTEAVSPAFVIDGYDQTSGQYATWTESIWATIEVRMFMQPSKRYEWFVCLTGILIFCLSFAFTYSIKRNAKELFDYPNLITASNI